MNLLVIDGQGGNLGATLIKSVKERFPGIDITAVGTNATATAAMVRAGAKKAATGENPVAVTAKKADIIVGPVGIVIANSMLGEITPKMAECIGSADATRILIPMNRCENIVAGVPELSLSQLVEDVLDKIGTIFNS